MSRFINKLKGAVTNAIDPSRPARILGYTDAVEAGLRAMGPRFAFDDWCNASGLTPDEQRDVALRVYERFFRRAMSDFQVKERERHDLGVVGHVLGLSAAEQHAAERNEVIQHLRDALSAAFADGVVGTEEAARLAAIVACAGLKLSEVTRGPLKNEASGLVRAAFSKAAERGQLEPSAWASIKTSSDRIGFDAADLCAAIAVPAHALVEHVFADASFDGVLTDAEERYIRWLLSELPLDQRHRDYSASQLNELLTLTRIRKGDLPVVNPCVVECRAGEIAHYQERARVRIVRQLASGRRVDEFQGVVVFTDYRFVFAGGTKNWALPYSKVLNCTATPNGFSLLCDGKGSGEYIVQRDGQRAFAILRAALAKANQRLVARSDESRNRNIARDVRQRVWQRYAGRCAECGATEYLEFDHIIPVAKGGSNGETNVQILCRKCNLRKSDRI